jgi:2-dehydropantoate 2-reductase
VVRVVVTGAGGIGTAIAGHLARSGIEVVLLGRSAPHIEAIRNQGLMMVGPDGVGERVDLRAVTTARGLGPADHVVIATKAFDTAGAADATRPVVGSATWVATVQNGLGNDVTLAEAFGVERVEPGLTTIGAERTAAGTVFVSGLTVSGRSLTQFGPPRVSDASMAGAEQLASMMTRAGLPAEATRAIDEAIWSKLALAVMGPVCALLGVTTAGAWADPGTRSVLEQMHHEVVGVAAAAGVAIDRQRSWNNAVRTYEGTGEHFPSMATDLKLGRRTEIDSITGAVVDCGRQHGVPTPVCGAVVALLRAAESVRRP